jgi:glycosyltransferase involved in cell wall biosynthesis
VGAGVLAEKIQRAASELSDVYLVGSQFGEALLQLYGLAGALIVPSESDPWALVVNEGMAAGLPVIVSRGCGSASVLVEEGRNGWTFEPGDADQLAELLGKASSVPTDELAQMGRRSREIIGAWSLDRYVRGVVTALEIPRRTAPPLAVRIAGRAWKGRVSVT